MTDIAAVFGDVFNIDEDKSENGAEHIIGYRDGKPIILKITEAGCDLHIAAQRKYQRALERTRGNKSENHKVWASVVAEGLLVGWENLLDANGKVIPPTIENRTQALIGNERLMNEVTGFAGDSTNFQREAAEDETEKN